jgi:hypothetical protein
MPNPHASLAAPYVICTADGVHLVGADAPSPPAKPASNGHDICVFASHLAGPAGEPSLAVGSAQVAALDAISPAPTAIFTPAPRHREQAARAPPTAL